MMAQPPTLGVFVQTHPGRGPSLDVLRRSLERSDVGPAYRVMMQKEGKSVVEHFLEVLRVMRDESDADLVLRLEDDALVNRHLRHNLTTWPAIHDKQFGSGWAMSPPLSIHDIIYRKRCDNPAKKRLIPICVAVMFWRRDMEWVIDGCERWFRDKRGNAMDFAMSAAVFDKGRKNYLHVPCLAEHRTNVKSTLGHAHKSSETSAGLYDEFWKR